MTTSWWLPVLRAHDAASAAALERLVLLQALTRPRKVAALAALAESLSFATVAPDGSRRSAALAAVVEGQ